MAIKKYNPGFLTDQEIVDSFCVRKAEFELIVEALRESTGNSNPHLIVIGPRGSGKTTLLLRVAVEVRRDPAFCRLWFPIIFAEESYEIATCGEFWLQCLSNLADQAPRRVGAPDLHLTFEELRTIQDDRTLADRCLATILDFADDEGKRLVLIVENLNTLFDDINDLEVGWSLRKTLQDEPRIFLVGSATSHFKEINSSASALYDFFQIHTLKRLNTKSCATLWKSVSERDIDERAIRSLEILTGGNPRLLTIVAQFGSRLSFRELMDDLLNLVDDHTEYFRSHLEALAPQERRVYLALAAIWKPATTKQVSSLARLTTSQCSALLGRLVERGAVLRSGGTPRRTEYYLTERMYNIYYLLRKGRGTDRVVEALVRFMKSFYSPSELITLRQRIIHEATSADESMRTLLQTALEHLSPHINDRAILGGKVVFINPSKRASFTRLAPDEHVPQAGDLLAQASQLLEDQRYDQAIKVCDQIESQLTAVGSSGSAEHVAEALVVKTASLSRLDRPEEALAVCNEILSRYSFNDSPAIVKTFAKAQAYRVFLACKLSLPAEEILAACEAFQDRFDSSESPAVAELRVKVLFNKGAVLAEMGQLGKALEVFDAVISRFSSCDSLDVQKLVAEALLGKGSLLEQQHHPEEACAAYDAVVDRFGSSDSPEVAEVVVKAMLCKGGLLRDLKRFDEALDIYSAIGLLVESYDFPGITGLAAMAQLSGATMLDFLNRPEDAWAAYDALVDRFGSQDSSEIAEHVATALVNKGNSLARSNRREEALKVYDAAVERYSGSQSHIVLQMVQRALLGRAASELALKFWEDAIDTTGRLLEGLGTDPSEIHVTSRLLRADAYFENGNRFACEGELAAMLKLLPSFASLPALTIDALMAYTIRFGPEAVLKLIEESPSASRLSPLVTALRQELGIESKVAEEVEEVAKDIRKDLAILRQLGLP